MHMEKWDVFGGNMGSYLVPAMVPRLEFFDYCYCSRWLFDIISVIMFYQIDHGEDIFFEGGGPCRRQSFVMFSLAHVGAVMDQYVAVA